MVTDSNSISQPYTEFMGKQLPTQPKITVIIFIQIEHFFSNLFLWWDVAIACTDMSVTHHKNSSRLALTSLTSTLQTPVCGLRSTADYCCVLNNYLPVRDRLRPVLVSEPPLLVEKQQSLSCFPLHKQALKRFAFRTFSSADRILMSLNNLEIIMLICQHFFFSWSI